MLIGQKENKVVSELLRTMICFFEWWDVQRHLWAVLRSETMFRGFRNVTLCADKLFCLCSLLHAAFSEGYGRVPKVVLLGTCRKKRKKKKEDRKTFFRGQLFIFSVSELKRKSQPKLQLY